MCGYVLHKMGREAEAIVNYQKALELQPVFPQCESNLGDAYVKLGQWEQARKAYLDVLRTSPDFAQAITGLAMVKQLSDNTR